MIFGPYNYGNVYNLIDKIYHKRFIFVGAGNNIKSVAYVENLVDATLFLLEYFHPGVQIFNYSDEPHLTIADFVELVIHYMPHGIPKIKIPLWLAIPIGSLVDVLGKLTGYNFPITAKRMKKFATSTYHKSTKIRELGFKQQITIEEGVRRTVEWYLQEQINKN